MKNIDRLECGHGESFLIRYQGEQFRAADPREKHYQLILAALQVGHAPGTPEGIPCWQRDLVFERWCAAWDLPTYREAYRLTYLIDNYRAAISSDLETFTRLDLGHLWRERKWTKLLDVIDRLPSYSWYASSVAQDEEHAKMLAESLAEKKDGDAEEDKGPSLTNWTPEVAALTNITDAVRRVEFAIYAAKIGDKAGKPPEPMARPVTAIEKAMRSREFNRRKAAHESLAARVLPHKRQSQDPVH